MINSFLRHVRPRLLAPLVLAVVTFSLSGASIHAQCVEVSSGLRLPSCIVQSSLGNLLVSEIGLRTPNSGRISIIDPDGTRRTLIDGLPNGIADVGDPSGPNGLFMRGRTLYVAVGVGDVGVAGPIPGSTFPNPNAPSSPLLSSVLAIHFSAAVEQHTIGFILPRSDHDRIAAGQKVTLSNGGGDKLSIELIANLPNYIPFPLPTVPGNVQLSNPFHLAVVDDQIYVTDGGRNLVWQVDIPTGAFAPLASFPNIPNPLFPAVGGPFRRLSQPAFDTLAAGFLVTLLRGAPFAPGTSVVEGIDPATGVHAPVISGLKTAIDVLPVSERGDTDHLVLQHASVGPFFGGPGLVLRFPADGGAPSLVSNCLLRPTSMTLDEKTGTIYVVELNTGRVLAMPLEP